VRAVAIHGTGIDLVPLESATARGVMVSNIPGGNARSVAEYCAMAMLMLARNVVAITSSLKNGTWDSARALGADSHEIGAMTLGLVGVGAMFCYFYAYSRMPLADVVAISFAAPVFVVALSVPLLGERVGARRWTAVLIGFLGVMVMLRPGPGLLTSVALVPLVGTLFFALAMIVLRRLGRTETSTSVAFTFTLACTLLSGLALPFVWVAPDLLDLAALIAVGLLGGVGQILMTAAFKHGDVADVVGEQQDQLGVCLGARLRRQVAVQFRERRVEVVGRVDVGRGHQAVRHGIHSRARVSARQRVTASGSSAGQQPARCWSGRMRAKPPGVRP